MPPEPQFAYREYFCARYLWILTKDQNWTLSTSRQRSERCGSDELFMSLGFPTEGRRRAAPAAFYGSIDPNGPRAAGAI